MKQHKAVIISIDERSRESDMTQDVNALNSLLEDGWLVESTEKLVLIDVEYLFVLLGKEQSEY